MDLRANVQKHKHKWTGPQGTLAFFGGGGRGGSDAHWWNDFVRVTVHV